jgi:hypothetical protein
MERSTAAEIRIPDTACGRLGRSEATATNEASERALPPAPRQVVFNKLRLKEVRVIAGLMLQETTERVAEKG